jgi:hypothetical protein
MSCCVEQTDGAPGSGGGAAAAAVDVRRLLPAGPASAGPLDLGIGNASSGTSSFVAPTNTLTPFTHTAKQQWTSAAAPGTTVGHRSGTSLWSRGANGGFSMRWVFSLSTLVVSAYRSYVGMRALATAIPSVDPSTLVNIIGVGFDPAAAPEWALMHNDGAGAATVVPLGIAVTTNDLMLLTIVTERSGADFTFRVRNVDTGADSGEIVVAADIPPSTTLLSEHVWLNSGADATTDPRIQVAEIEAQTTPF